MKLDLCGIAKGYGVDVMAKVLDDFGIESGLVGIDGDMRALGAKLDGRLGMSRWRSRIIACVTLWAWWSYRMLRLHPVATIATG
nr:FAD:protein FMN transferase [uncultured Cohaesibacter sp.]